MTIPHFPTEPLNIPQAVLDTYHSHFNNTTYKAFRDALAATLTGGASHPDHVAVMNLLIDAAFERSGATVYQGAAAQLGAALMTYGNPELFTLAEAHLALFSPLAEDVLLTAGLLDALSKIRLLAEQTTRAASGYHGWRGRVAFWWLSAITATAQAAHAILSEADDSYAEEKLTRAVLHLRNGLQEGTTVRLKVTETLKAWFMHLSTH